jgi:1-deoxy-D-xylulose-5-phosphate reductoisomerase
VSRTRVAILGSTGSVGRQALAIAREHADRFEVVALQAHASAAALAAQARAFRPGHVALTGSAEPPEGLAEGVRFHGGKDATPALLGAAEPDVVLGSRGPRGCRPRSGRCATA